MTPETRKRWMKRAAIGGALLGVACHFLPPDYKVVCQAAAKITAVSCGAGV